MDIPIQRLEDTGCFKELLPGIKVGSLECLSPLLQNAVNLALFFSGIVAVFLIIYAGVLFVTSGGDKTKIETARKTITYTIIGLLVIIFSYFIIHLLYDIVGYTPKG